MKRQAILLVAGAVLAFAAPSAAEDAIAAGFGIAAFDGSVDATPAGDPFTQAGGHPYAASTIIDFNTVDYPDKGDGWPAEPVKNIDVDLPPGFIGNPTTLSRCRGDQLAPSPVPTDPTSALPFCPSSSQAGVITLRFDAGIDVGLGQGIVAAWPVFSMEPPPDAPARFGFNFIGTVVTFDARVRSGFDYGVTVNARNVSEGLPFTGARLTLWGVPADPAHDAERACPKSFPPAFGGPSCSTEAPLRPFLRLPTSCTDAGVGLKTTIRSDSWIHPGDFTEASFLSHLPPGRDLLPIGSPPPSIEPGPQQGPTGCGQVPFDPILSVQPTTGAADSPTGLDVDLTLPQNDDPGRIGESDLERAVVKLPRGMSVNPAAADGLGACTSSQIGLITDPGISPARFDTADPRCPNSSKVGVATIETPLLGEALQGSVYLAKQADNPFGSLLAFYIVAKAQGVIVKLPAKIDAGDDGQLTTTLDEAPQTPFSAAHLRFFGGTRAPLKTPVTCGTYSTEAILTPWSGNDPVALSSSFEITSGPNGSACSNAAFDPKLSAGVSNPVAGSYSPFALRLSREDGNQLLGAISAQLPQGLTGKLAGIPYCPDAALAAVSGAEGTGASQLASPSCPQASQVGTVTVGAGAGPNPFYVHTGKAYLAGPYKGAPLSLAVVTPAVAGPFDLGSVVVRNALRVDPVTAQIAAVSDPLPTILHGIPLSLRDVRVNIDRPEFTLNPTSCDPMSVDSAITSTQGVTANPSSRFQVANCERLPFKPKLSLKVSGGMKRGDFPKLRAVLKAKPGEANIDRVSVALPHSEFLAQEHIRTICTRVQYAADQCPAGSIYGHARAFTPLLDQPLEGPVYLRSSSNPLPDLVVALKGQIEIDLAGRIDSVDGGIRNSFELVPDAPVSKFVLEMKGGKKGLLVNSRNLCKGTNRATVLMDGQNGKAFDARPVLRNDCGKNGRARAKRG